MERADFLKLVKSIGGRSAKLSDDINVAALVAIAYADEHGDFDMTGKLLNALYNGRMSAAINRLISFFEAHGPFIIRLIKDDQGNYFNVKKHKADDAQAFVVPTVHWNDFNREADEQAWLEDTFVKGIVSRIKKANDEHGALSDDSKIAILNVLGAVAKEAA